MSDVTQILDAIESGDPQAAGELLPLVYSELRRLAAQHISTEKPGQTLDATALVHEAYLRLVGDRQFVNRGHFFAAAAEAMRRILVDQARRKLRTKRGGGMRRIEMDQLDFSTDEGADDFLELDAALEQLATEDPLVARIVHLRYYTGLTMEETAAATGISVRTANRHWAYARAWLFQYLHAAD